MPEERFNTEQDEGGDRPPIEIHTDEDWKSRVKAEDAAIDRAFSEKKGSESETVEQAPAEQAPAAEPATATGNDAAASSGGDRPDSEQRLPPADFSTLVVMLSTQAMATMGVLPDEEGNPLPKQLNVARHMIDLLGVVEEKTRGNLEQRETELLTNSLHELRMMYVQQSK